MVEGIKDGKARNCYVEQDECTQYYYITIRYNNVFGLIHSTQPFQCTSEEVEVSTILCFIVKDSELISYIAYSTCI